MKNLNTFLKTRKAKVLTVVAAVAGSSAAVQAADYSAQIGTAVTDGTANNTLVIAGVIGVAILGFGVGRMLGWFGK